MGIAQSSFGWLANYFARMLDKRSDAVSIDGLTLHYNYEKIKTTDHANRQECKAPAVFA